MDIEEMETKDIFAALIEKVEYEEGHVGKNTGSSPWTEAEKDRLSEVASKLHIAFEIYKKRTHVQVSYR